MWLRVPGLAEALRALLAKGYIDLSTQDRFNRLLRTMRLVNERPWLGLGNDTWSIEDYSLIDNQVDVSLLRPGMSGSASQSHRSS